MYTKEQMERIKRYNRETEEKVFDIWLSQYDDKDKKDEPYYDPRYDRE